MIKRITAFLIAFILLIFMNLKGELISAEDDEITILVNGNYLYSDVAPIIVEGRTLVPLRAIFEALGVWVDWNGDTQTVTAGINDITISLQIGSNTLIKNGSCSCRKFRGGC